MTDNRLSIMLSATN